MIPHSKPTLGELEARAADDAVRSGFVGAGERTRRFENVLAARLNCKYAHATSSGSAALYLALKAVGVTRGQEVILPALLCRAVLNVVLAVGAQPVLADINPSDLTMSLDSARAKIGPRTAAVILPHMFGAVGDVDGFARLGIPFVEDTASSLGATYHGKPVGSFGDVSILSFASTKMITAGQGGMALTDRPDISEALTRLMDYDGAQRDDAAAFNFQFSDLQAAVGLAQTERLDDFLQTRAEIAAHYTRVLQDLPGAHLPQSRRDSTHAYYRYVITLDRPSGDIVRELQAQGIDARSSVAHYLYDYVGLPESDFPGCRAVREQLLSLPIYPSLEPDDYARIAAATRRALTAQLAVQT